MRWLKGRRPPEPIGWKAKVGDAERRVEKALRKRSKALPEGDEAELFENHWTDAKADYARVQHHKCGYCEAKVTSDHAGGAMDHYRPKGRVEEIVSQGRQMQDSTRIVSGSRVQRIVGLGYWWLAYAWDNYLLACGDCNSRWKLGAFPVEGGHKKPPTRASVQREKPLLLDPFGDNDPAEHLLVSEFGELVERNGSARGRATITTCNLNRDTLRKERRHLVTIVRAWLKHILNAQVDLRAGVAERAALLAEAKNAVANIHHFAQDESPFCGVVRILACDELGLARWEDFGPALVPDL